MGMSATTFSKQHTAEDLWGVLHRSVSDIPNPLWACPFTGVLDEGARTEEGEEQLRREIDQDLTTWRPEYEGCLDSAQLAQSAAETLRERLTGWLERGVRPGGHPLQQQDRERLQELVQALERWTATLEELEWPELPSDEELEDEDLDELVDSLGLLSHAAEEIGDRVSEICEEVYAMEVPGVEVPAVLREPEQHPGGGTL